MGVRGLQSGRLERELRAGRASQQAEYLRDIGPHRVLRHARGGCHLAVAQPLDNRPVDVLQAFWERADRADEVDVVRPGLRVTAEPVRHDLHGGGPEDGLAVSGTAKACDDVVDVHVLGEEATRPRPDRLLEACAIDEGRQHDHGDPRVPVGDEPRALDAADVRHLHLEKGYVDAAPIQDA